MRAEAVPPTPAFSFYLKKRSWDCQQQNQFLSFIAKHHNKRLICGFLIFFLIPGAESLKL